MTFWAGDRVRVKGLTSVGGRVLQVEHDDHGRKLLHVALEAFSDATGDVPVPYFETELEPAGKP